MSAEPVARWLAELDHDQFTVRERATEELAKLGPMVAPVLRKTLDGSPPLEMRRRAERLLQQLQEAVPSPERLRALRALEVLEEVGTPAARRVLEELAGGAADAELTVGARRTLERLGRRVADQP
jgi:hypothetical protein